MSGVAEWVGRFEAGTGSLGGSGLVGVYEAVAEADDGNPRSPSAS